MIFKNVLIGYFWGSRVSENPSHHIKKALKHLESEKSVSSCKIHFQSVLEPF